MLVIHYSTVKLSLLYKLNLLVGPGSLELEKTKTSMMQFFAKIVNGFHRVTIFAKSYILDVRLDS